MAQRSDMTTLFMLAAAAGGAILAAKADRRSRRSDFRDKVVVITGGSRGLGLVLARELAREGAKLALLARDEEELAQARIDVQEIAAGAVLTVPCDLRQAEEAERAASQILQYFGRIDVLVNNAGTIRVGPLETMTLQDFRDQMDSNFWSAVHAVNAVLPDMRTRKSGRIVNISSIGGKVAVPHLLPYSASKFALAGYSRGLRSELMKDGIVVSTIYPGLMRTGSPRHAEFKGQNEKEYAWFSIADSLPILSVSAENAAKSIIAAAKKGEAEAVIGMPSRLLAVVDQLLPELSAEILCISARILPAAADQSGPPTRGAESESIFSPSFLTALTDKAAVRNNEMM